MNKREVTVICLLSLAVFLLAFLLSGRFWFRVDMTRNKVYTLSDLSRNLHREISDNIRITYFVSDRLVLAHPVPATIADLLREYAAVSRGKIRFVQRDPAREDLRGVVEELGIIPWQIQVVERNESTVATVYSGILIEYMDQQAVMPLVFSLDALEYNISSRIRSVVRNTRRQLGVIVGDAHKDWDTDYSLLNRELFFSGFNVRFIGDWDDIPAGLGALFVLGGVQDMDDYRLYDIDRFIMEGGGVLFALDGVFVDAMDGFNARVLPDMGLLAMLANYGVLLHRALVLDRSALNVNVVSQSASGTDMRTIPYPHWIAVQEQSANTGHPLTARFAGLDLYWASPLELAPLPAVEAEVLFTSSPQAWLQTENFICDPNMLSRFEDEEAQTRGTKILAAALSGIFPSAFEDDSSGYSRPARLIVAGDADFAGPLMQLSQSEARNLDFLVRAALWLSGEDDMLAIHSGREGMGRLDRITDRERKDTVIRFSLLLNLVIVPLGIIFAGFFAVRRRRK